MNLMPNYNSPYMPRYSQSNGIIWVQGIEGAKAYQLMPNSNVVLLDSENDGRFYIKICDSVGMCTLRLFDYTEVTEAKPQSTEYVTREEFNQLLSQLGGLDNGKSVVSAVDEKPLITK